MGLSIIFNTYGQQDVQYSHNMFNQMTVNPGYAGSQDMLCFNLLRRDQWHGFPGGGAPTSTVFSFNAPFNLFEKSHGVGLSIINNSIALNNDLALQISYAYRLKMKIGDGRLGLGISGGFINSKLRASQFKGPQSGSLMDIAQDYDIPNTDQTKQVFDMDMGIYYKTEKLYMGISCTHVLGGTFNFTNSNQPTTNLNTDYKVQHFYITSGYTYQTSDPMYELIPSFFLENDGRTTVLNLNTNLVYNNRIWGGLTYRVGEAFTALFGFTFHSDIKFGIAYDYDTNQLSQVSYGSFEVDVIYNFKLKKEKIPQRYKSIRFL